MRGGGLPGRAGPPQAEGAPPRPEFSPPPTPGHDAEAARGEPRASPARRELGEFGPWGPWVTLGPKRGSGLGRRAPPGEGGCGGEGSGVTCEDRRATTAAARGKGLQRLLPNARRPGGQLCLRGGVGGGEAGSTPLTGPDPARGWAAAPSVRCLLRPSPQGSAPRNRELPPPPPPPTLSRTLSAAPSFPRPHLRAPPGAGLPQPLGGLSSSSLAPPPPPPRTSSPRRRGPSRLGLPQNPGANRPPSPGNGGFVWNPIQTTP